MLVNGQISVTSLRKELTEDDWNGILMMIEMFDEDNSSGLNLDEFTNMNMMDMSNEMMFNNGRRMISTKMMTTKLMNSST